MQPQNVAQIGIRCHDHQARHKTWTGHVTNKVAGGGGAAMAGNVLVGGIIGAVVDGNNGSMLDLVPNPLVVKLEAGEDAPASGSVAGVGN